MTAPWVIAVVTLWVFVVVLGLLVLGLLRRVSGFLEMAEFRLRGASIPPGFGGLEPGSLVPEFELHEMGNGTVRSSDVLQSATLLVFMDAGCEPCEDLAILMQESWVLLQDIPMVIVAEDSPEAAVFPFPPGARILYQANRAVSNVFENIASPQAFALRDGVVAGKSIPDSLQDLERLVRLLEGGGEDARTTSDSQAVTG